MSRRSLRKVCARRNLPNFDVYLKGMRENVLGNFVALFQKGMREMELVFFSCVPKRYARDCTWKISWLFLQKGMRETELVFFLLHTWKGMREMELRNF